MKERQPEKNGYRLTITGIVQGVGFRPFLYHLAQKYGLKGRVYNSTAGVIVEIEGTSGAVESFLGEIERRPPPQAVIHRIIKEPVDVAPGSAGFRIEENRQCGNPQVFPGPDLGMCHECLRETQVFDNRRFKYPFTNCTHCGPRYTIIEALPYERKNTVMTDFPMCPDCSREYRNPADRRFHAEPIACARCGPSLILYRVTLEGYLQRQDEPDILAVIGKALNHGELIAVKGLGGFHLTGDSTRDETVLKIRKVKGRAEKPLAIICRDLAQVRQLCVVTANEEKDLTSTARPIVIMAQRRDSPYDLSFWIAPGFRQVGVMLPYTPLHQILLEQTDHPLVMTSYNPESLPMFTDESQLTPQILQGVNWVLAHDRKIVARCDDSVLISSPQRILMRRARGFAPAPVRVPNTFITALGVGGDVKNTVCFLQRDLAVLTPHLGNLENEETIAEWRSTVTRFQSLLSFHPELVGCDAHPGYVTRRIAHELDLPLVEVQHHHAHIASGMAENLLTGPVLGIALDGTGYGPDGSIWGGELLIADYSGYQRVGSLFSVPLPGGDQAIREPWRMALSYLHSAYGSHLPEFPGCDRWNESDARLLLQIIGKDFYPMTSSVGRLFDAIASLMGLAHRVSYEGQAAMALESLAQCCQRALHPYEFAITETDGRLQLILSPCIQGIISDLALGKNKVEIARAFHSTIAIGIASLCQRIRKQTGLKRTVLSGGVFQNKILLTELSERLIAAGFQIYTQRMLPPNDGGLSLGQSMVAAFSQK